MIKYINLAISHDEYQSKISPLIEKIFLKGNFVGGEEVEEFENNFAKYCGVKYAISVNSGTDALFLALKVLGIGHDDEVITVPNSFIATANAISLTGAQPVFADINEDDLLIDISKIEKLITSKTKAIIPVHLCGLMCDMDEIVATAKKYNLYIIEDAAQSVGSLYKNRKAGSIGDIGCFSLFPLKNLGGIGDGGIITTNNEKIANKLKILRNHGLKNRDELEVVGINSRLDTINAIILNERLKVLDKIILERNKKAKLYKYYLESVKEIKLQKIPDYKYHSYHVLMIIAENRDKLREYLMKNGIETKIHYPLLITEQRPYKQYNYNFVLARQLVKKILTLPIANLDDAQIKFICDKIKDFYA